MGDPTFGQFHIDTKGICLLCLKDCTLYDYTSRAKQAIGSCTRSISFKLLLRYLKINLFKLVNFPPLFLQSMDAGEDADVVISLCEDCHSLTKSFGKLYENMEEIRLQLDACVHTVYEVMKYGGGQRDRVEEYERRRRSQNMVEMMTANIAEMLRKETMQKCSLKVEAFIPRITLYKRDEASMASFIGGPSSSSISSSFDKNGKAGPKSKKGQENFHLKQLLMKPQAKTELYPDSSSSLFNGVALATATVAGNGGANNMATKKTSRRRKKPRKFEENDHPNLIRFNNETDGAIEGEEFVVKLEPIISALAQTYQGEVDPLEGGEVEDGGDLEESPTATSTTSKTNNFACTFCTRKFNTAWLLSRHHLLAHPDQQKKKGKKPTPMSGKQKRRMKCKVCSKMMASKTSLMLHMRKSHGGGAASKKAKQDKSPPSPKKNKVGRPKKIQKMVGVGRGNGRVTTSSGPGIIECSYCDKIFSSKQVFQTHMVAIHSLQVYKKYLPDGTTEEQLNAAIMSAFDEHNFNQEDKKKQYGCPYCRTGYPHPSHLRLHIIRRHFDVISNKFFDGQGGEEGLRPFVGAGFEFEFDNGSMEEEESVMYQMEFENENELEEMEGEGAANGLEGPEGMEEETVDGDSPQGEGEEENPGDDDDSDEAPPILMRETYSLSEQHTSLEGETELDNVEEEEDNAAIPIPIVQSEGIF